MTLDRREGGYESSKSKLPAPFSWLDRAALIKTTFTLETRFYTSNMRQERPRNKRKDGGEKLC